MKPNRKIIVTGGAGFIGSAVCRYLLANTDADVICIDKLTYAGSSATLDTFIDNRRAIFEQFDITDRPAMERIVRQYQPDAIMNLAAESHVDRSIDSPMPFIESNIVGTAVLLEVARNYWRELEGAKRTGFRFHQISTDEVFGSLGPFGLFTETTPYDPSSPYSASKASADHLARAWYRTFGLPVVLTNCSNNYGPFHFPEKLIPMIILNGLEGKPLPVYGTGDNIRDWLYVEDHAEALALVVAAGRPGESYNVGGNNERRNIDLVREICRLLDEMAPSGRPHEELITFVTDRPGHDKRYAIDNSKIVNELGWQPRTSVEEGLRRTVMWFLESRWWWEPIRAKIYRGDRLGLTGSAAAVGPR